MSSTLSRDQTRGEELANTVSHGLGAVLALAGAAVAIVVAALAADPFRITAASIYGASLFLVFLSSTLYHGLPGRFRPGLMLFDHVCIYLLIAGTYTPFALVTLRGPWGWSLLGGIWGLAIVGVVFKVLTGMRYPTLSTALYAAMGWVGVLAAGPITSTLAGEGVALVVAGGVAYTLGIPFFVWQRLPFHHVVWHGWVLLGAALHFAAVLGYVLL